MVSFKFLACRGGFGEPTLTDRLESNVSSEGGRRLNFRRPGPNLKGN